jgi:hypothetical protein
MPIIRGAKTSFIWPNLIIIEEGTPPLGIAHEVAHFLLYIKGFCRSWARAVGFTELQYEALVWSACARFVKSEFWDLDYIQRKLDTFK